MIRNEPLDLHRRHADLVLSGCQLQSGSTKHVVWLDVSPQFRPSLETQTCQEPAEAEDTALKRHARHLRRCADALSKSLRSSLEDSGRGHGVVVQAHAFLVFVQSWACVHCKGSRTLQTKDHLKMLPSVALSARKAGGLPVRTETMK